MGYGDALRDEVHNESITPLIGVFGMYSASVAAQQHNGMFVSGFGFAASYYGLPDIGFIAMVVWRSGRTTPEIRQTTGWPGHGHHPP
jgi:2-methylisocitrate lyase-like PEP mutase family enzyme